MFMKEKKNNKILKPIIWFIKSLCIGVTMIFIFNIVGSFFNMNVPVNVWTILIVSVLKLPGLASIIVFLMIT